MRILGVDISEQLARIVNRSQDLIPSMADENGPLPYRLTSSFLSPAESSYYESLSSYLATKAAICLKVRLQDLLVVPDQQRNSAYVRKIQQEHVDFLVCDAETMKPVLAIKLVDATQWRPEHRERDRFINAAFEAADFPLLRVPVKPRYTQQEIADQLKASFSKSSGNKPESGPQNIALDIQQRLDGKTGAPICPKCEVPMVLRIATKGKQKGRKFYACVNFPQCRELRPVA